MLNTLEVSKELIIIDTKWVHCSNILAIVITWEVLKFVKSKFIKE